MVVWEGELISDTTGLSGSFPHQRHGAVPHITLKESVSVIPVVPQLCRVNVDTCNSLVGQKPKSSSISKVKSTKLVERDVAKVLARDLTMNGPHGWVALITTQSSPLARCSFMSLKSFSSAFCCFHTTPEQLLVLSSHLL